MLFRSRLSGRVPERRELLHERDVEHDQRARSSVDALTPTERKVFDLVVRGKLNKQIALDLGTAERTIKWHRHNLMQKLQVQSLAELVSLAERLGLTSAPDRRDAETR